MKITELQQVSRNKVGLVMINGVKLEPHEYNTILFLVLYGFNIEAIKPVNTPLVNNPDFLIDGAVWEAKSPEGSGKYTIQRQFHNAGHQSDRMILDLRRIKMPAEKAEAEAIKRFGFSRRIKQLRLITKSGKLLDIRK